MITVNYLDGVDNIQCDEHLFQWDNGQKLCLSGLNTYVSNLETVDVHFCNKISKLAITVKPTVVSNNVVAPIPNSLLQDPYPIIAYFYVPSDNGSRTIVMVTIPIEPKKRPSDFILNEDEAIASLEAINNKVNTTLNNITVDYNNFKTNIEAELRDMVDNLQLSNADTVDGKHASDFTQIIDFGFDETDTKIAVGLERKTTIYQCGRWTDYPSIFQDGQGTVIAINYSGSGTAGVARMWCKQIFISPHRMPIFIRSISDTYVGEWKDYRDGGNADTLDNKHASDFVLNSNLPTSLPANGGNADYATNAGNATNADYATNAGNSNTVGGKSASDFISMITNVESDTSVTSNFVDGIYSCYQWADSPSGYPDSQGILIVNNYGNGGQPSNWKHLTFMSPHDDNVHHGAVANGIWYGWRKLNDGGNASTVNGVRLMVGTREPQCEEPNALAYVPEGAWYGRY